MGQRIVTGLVAGTAFFCLLWLGDWYYSLLLVAMAIIGYSEFAKLNGHAWSRWDVLAGFVGVIILALTRLPESWGVSLPSFATVSWLLMFALLAATVFSKNKIQLEHAAVLFIGAIYVGTGFHYMAATRELDHGIFWSMLTFVSIWTSDAGAYFVGKAIGRTKLWPAISPNKTIEGALGGLVLAVVAALAFAYFGSEWIGYGRAALIGLTAAIAGQLGDLIQSAYKRFRGVKDSGNLLPGHGGVLDRTDSWLIVFPLVHLLTLIP
ncbi:phosphatidate cytidylyltransferase [Cohnella faecalis]|uniref:Phosphatidate cytidylyltransferase n=1 Tax=Cohnella faecalis TaxID=2315694 RepID=A0A398CPK4_9BACL|nr:phosphatidate cytidylyltransferase [Cohnella faecalis]RIE00874.1 phosphatidate cytidylyltransferase [Cohnella faecalis]RIE03318.1 phosphatidate cytidylyltransferase [Cohnella faecalis]